MVGAFIPFVFFMTLSMSMLAGVDPNANPILVSISVFAPQLIAFLIALVLMSAMIVAFVLFEVAKQACNSLQIGDIGEFERAAQTAQRADAHGEGLADALDVGAI